MCGNQRRDTRQDERQGSRGDVRDRFGDERILPRGILQPATTASGCGLRFVRRFVRRFAMRGLSAGDSERCTPR